MGLEDSFEIESETVPKGELAGGSAGDKTTAFGGPRHAEDGTAHFVCCGFHVAGGDSIDWVIKEERRRYCVRSVGIVGL